MIPNVVPPAPPWKDIKHNGNSVGVLSFYYSDNLSKLPVRAVTKVGDNKADPNLETQTYGMFSTCQKGMRAAFVKEGRRYLFFVTRRRGERVIVGYYTIKWYSPAVNTDGQDFALAADSAYFIAQPVSLEEVDKVCKTRLNRRFRNELLIPNEDCQRLVEFLHKQPNAISDYVSEIHRLEHFNRAQGKYKYVGRKQEHSFTWEIASQFILPKDTSTQQSAGVKKNSSPSGWWTCTDCRGEIKNMALLRECPDCGGINTLVSMPLPPVQL